MIRIDGSMGEGGGQILRTALALSLCLNIPFRIDRIRAARRRPGLQRQHLAAVEAAAAIGQAEVRGAEPDSESLVFVPGAVTPGEYQFDIGTAGSTTLVLQTILPPLMCASAASRLHIVGGTHNPMAPPFEFLASAFMPLIERMGPRVDLLLERPGYYPSGGGALRATIHPARQLAPLQLSERGAIRALRAEALLSHLPRHIAERELRILAEAFGLEADRQRIREDARASSPGNALSLFVEAENVTEVFTGIGRRGLPAERVAQGVVEAAREYLEAGVAVGRHLADQLLVPLALAGSGKFTTLAPSRHATTNIAVIRQFMAVRFAQERLGERQWRIAVAPAA